MQSYEPRGDDLKLLKFTLLHFEDNIRSLEIEEYQTFTLCTDRNKYDF